VLQLHPESSAVRCDQIEAVKLLLSRGARTDLRDKDGLDAPGVARKRNRTGIADLLSKK
jgi:ankyrin repeat protein